MICIPTLAYSARLVWLRCFLLGRGIMLLFLLGVSVMLAPNPAAAVVLASATPASATQADAPETKAQVPRRFPALSPVEAQISRTIEREYERSVRLLERLVNQNSGTFHHAGVKIVGDMMRAELEPLGFAVRWVPMEKAGRAGHLIATHRGKTGAKRVLLIGHLDTVYEQDSPFQKFKRIGESAEGPGVGDDKGGMVVIVAALRAMQAAGVLAAANIEVVLTGDEENAGDPIALSRADLIAAGERADVALDFEGLVIEKGTDMGSLARRSSNSWTLSTSGKTGHSSLIFNPEHGDGAINELVRILARFRAELPEHGLTFNVGLIAGGDQVALDDRQVRAVAGGKTNIIAAKTIARGDMRALSREQIQRVKTKMTKIVADHAPATHAELRFDPGGYPPMAPTPGNHALFEKLSAVNHSLGLPPMGKLDPLKRGAGDISFVAHSLDSLAGLGTYSTGDHAPGETVDLTSIRRQAKRAAILISRISAEPR